MSRSVSKYPGIVFYSNINKYVQHLTITFKPCLYSCYIKLTWNVQANQLSLYSVTFLISITCILKQTHVKGSFRCIHLYTNFNYDADDYIYDIIVEIPSTIRSQFYINLKARYQMWPVSLCHVLMAFVHWRSRLRYCVWNNPHSVAQSV